MKFHSVSPFDTLLIRKEESANCLLIGGSVRTGSFDPFRLFRVERLSFEHASSTKVWFKEERNIYDVSFEFVMNIYIQPAAKFLLPRILFSSSSSIDRLR